MRTTLERLSAARCASFLAVLKRFEHDERRACSASRCAGWTLALDIPARGGELGELLDGLDELVADAGGRVYLTKDSRLAPELLPAMYPQLDRLARGPRPASTPRTSCAATWTAGSTSPASTRKATPMKDALGSVQSVLVLGGGSDIARATCDAAASRRRSARRARGAQARGARPTRVADDPRRGRRRRRRRRVRRHRLRARTSQFVATTFDRFGDFDVVLVAFGVLGDQDAAEVDGAAAARRSCETNFTGVVSVTVPLAQRLEAAGPRHARAALERRGRAGPPFELRLRLVEGRRRRVLPRPRRRLEGTACT